MIFFTVMSKHVYFFYFARIKRYWDHIVSISLAFIFLNCLINFIKNNQIHINLRKNGEEVTFICLNLCIFLSVKKSSSKFLLQ